MALNRLYATMLFLCFPLGLALILADSEYQSSSLGLFHLLILFVLYLVPWVFALSKSNQLGKTGWWWACFLLHPFGTLAFLFEQQYGTAH